MLKNLLHQLRQQSASQLLLFTGSLLLMFGLFWMRAFISFGTVLITLSIFFSREAKLSFKNLPQNIPALILITLFVFLAISVAYTENMSRWQELLARKLPVLLFPLAFCLSPSLSERKKNQMLFFYVSALTLIAIPTIINYLLNRHFIDAMITHSKNVQAITGIFHIHFSIMIAIGVFISYYLWTNTGKEKFTQKTWLAICTVVLFLSLHILAYRTGLLILYATLFFDVLLLIFRQKKLVTGLALLASIILFPLIAYNTINSVKLRVQNTVKDIQQYRDGKDINFHSISQRMAAWETAWAIFKQHPVIGVAPADLEPEMERQYEKKDFGLYPANRVLIHNQYLHSLVTTGIAGFLLFMSLFAYPLMKRAIRNDFLAQHFLVLMLAAMLVDSFFELQVGLNLFVFFYCLFVVSKFATFNKS